ncbi:MAG: RidA family protein [Spirochaetes bacterium]|nr:RidA family protein [Spirochaetota bacterium]
MQIKHYNFDNLPKGGPYTHVVEANGFLFISGVIPIDTAKNIVVDNDIAKATELVLNNIKTIIESAGSKMENIVKITVYLKDMKHFSLMNEIYKKFFPINPPARSCIGVFDLPAGAPIEIDAIAIL